LVKGVKQTKQRQTLKKKGVGRTTTIHHRFNVERRKRAGSPIKNCGSSKGSWGRKGQEKKGSRIKTDCLGKPHNR